MNKSRILKFSIFINIIFIIMFGGLCIWKRNSIYNRIYALKTKAPSEAVLKTFNNEPLEIANGTYTSQNLSTDKSISILFLGNSLTRHGIVENLWDTKGGMAASSEEKDFVHLLMNKISKEKKTNINYSITNISTFERAFASPDFNAAIFNDWLKNAEVLKNSTPPDFVIIQIGENMSRDDVKLNDGQTLKEKYSELLSLFPSSKKIITLPFWPDRDKNNVITQVAVENNAVLVDLSHLGIPSGNGMDYENFAKSQKHYANTGVGDHPGDIGMQKIADCLYTVVGNLIQ